MDAGQGYILPGLIDIHTHGGAGSDFMDATYEDTVRIARFQASHGVTGVVATTLTAPLPEITGCLEVLRRIVGRHTGGAQILGVHLEGPFLAPGNKGAHLAEFLLHPEPRHYEPLLQYRDIIKTVTVAPELPGAPEFIAALVRHQIVVSGGHDTATDQEILVAIEQGMTHTTHAFCVMSSLQRKNGRKHLGLCEMMLLDERLTTEIIADNKHTPPLLAALILKCKGPGKTCIVSDCLRAAGMPKDDTLYPIGPRNAPKAQVVVVDDGVAMLPDRSLNAGSITTLDSMIKNLINSCGGSLVEAVRMASLTPAEIIRIDQWKGSIAAGKDADICIADRDLTVQRTLVGGDEVYRRPGMA